MVRNKLIALMLGAASTLLGLAAHAAPFDLVFHNESKVWMHVADIEDKEVNPLPSPWALVGAQPEYDHTVPVGIQLPIRPGAKGRLRLDPEKFHPRPQCLMVKLAGIQEPALMLVQLRHERGCPELTVTGVSAARTTNLAYRLRSVSVEAVEVGLDLDLAGTAAAQGVAATKPPAARLVATPGMAYQNAEEHSVHLSVLWDDPQHTTPHELNAYYPLFGGVMATLPTHRCADSRYVTLTLAPGDKTALALDPTDLEHRCAVLQVATLRPRERIGTFLVSTTRVDGVLRHTIEPHPTKGANGFDLEQFTIHGEPCVPPPADPAPVQAGCSCAIL